MHTAPEMILDKKMYSKDVDWWMFGLVILEIAIGRKAFSTTAFFTEIKESCIFEKNICEETPPPVIGYSTDFSSLIKGLLCKDPTKRLGFGKDDFRTVKEHPFFKGIEWERFFLI